MFCKYLSKKVNCTVTYNFQIHFKINASSSGHVESVGAIDITTLSMDKSKQYVSGVNK